MLRRIKWTGSSMTNNTPFYTENLNVQLVGIDGGMLVKGYNSSVSIKVFKDIDVTIIFLNM